MDDKPGSYSAEAQLAKVAAGFKGGPMYKNPITPPPMDFVTPDMGDGRFEHKPIVQSAPEDVWNQRRK